MHGVERHEERLHGGVVGDAAAAHRVALHAVHEDLDAAVERVEELSLVGIGLHARRGRGGAVVAASLPVLVVILTENGTKKLTRSQYTESTL